MRGTCKGCGEEIVIREAWPNEWHSVADNAREHYVNVCAGNLSGKRSHVLATHTNTRAEDVAMSRELFG